MVTTSKIKLLYMSKSNVSKIIPLLLIGTGAYFLIRAIGNAFGNVPNNLQVGNVKLRTPRVSFPNITIPTDIEIVNYNSIPLTVDALYTALIFKGKNIGTANFIQKVEIKALNKAVLPVNVTVSLLAIGQEVYDSISQGGNVVQIFKRLVGDMQVQGNVYSNGIAFPINAPITF